MCQAVAAAATGTGLFVLRIVFILNMAVMADASAALGGTTEPAFRACETCHVAALQARNHKTGDNLLADRA
jgi:cytochrome c2